MDSDEYDLAALFFSQPKHFNDLPSLLALGSEHELLMSRGLQSVQIFGRYPSDQEISWLAKQASPSGLRFKLPPTRAQRLSSLQRQVPALEGLRTSRVDKLFDEQGRLRSRPTLAAERLRRDPPRLVTPAHSTPQLPQRTSPQPPRKPSPPVYDTTCQARTRRGQRCRKPAQSARTSVCEMHIDMIAAGKRVLWHETGTQIRLKER